MRKRIFETMAVVGSLVTIQSVAWEVARMEPAYRFLVSPWSIRGYETVHGAVYAVTGALLLGSVLLVMAPRAQKAKTSAIVAGLIAGAAVAAAAVFGREPATIPLNAVTTWLAAAVLASVITRLVPESVIAKIKVPAIRLVMFAVSLVVIGVLATVAGGEDIEMPLFLVMLLVMAVAAAWSTGVEPRELAASRMLVIASVLAWLSIAVSAGALRSTLVRAQDVAAEYRDTQVTWGYFLANIGAALVFAGAVAMWAKRRDRVMAAQRARRQREAALKSAAEIEAALESSTS
ncbi:MAG TPA: hypothetical protein VGC47_13360 [Acidimicrobiia bacterium]